MLFLIGDANLRPNMIEDTKDEEYHLNFGRYCVGQANNQRHVDYVTKIRLNKDFYKTKQWSFDEDLEAFFKDENNQPRNRIKVINNIIRPMVENYRGNAVRMQINARVKSISPMAISRREKKLNEMLFYSRVANEEDNPFGDQLKKKLPIGNSDSETQEIFDNLYIDSYVQTMNSLLEYVSERNRFESMQQRIAEEMALSGIAIMKNYEYGGHQNFEFVESENFFWDRSGKEYNLTDAEFMGENPYLTTSQIFEENQDLRTDQRQAIENYARQYHKVNMQYGAGSRGNVQSSKYETGGRVPTFVTYWRDTQKYEYGYVLDEFGYPYLTKINFTYEGEDAPRYTDADLIEVDTVRSREVLGGKLKKKIYVDIMRYCKFIPREVLASVSDSPEDAEKFKDIVFEWGIAPYQETESLEVNNVQFPYKCYCWGYIDGEVLSPVDDAISPQRMINRILSVAENQINNSRGAGTFYDKSMVDAQGGESELLRNMNQSRPVGINAKGRGIQNAVSQYDGTVKQGTMVLFNIVDVLNMQVQRMTGINEALKGENTGSDQLVGVTQLMIQRGSLMQEPFYNAVTEIFLQCYQSIATVGKRIYADNERELTMAVGDNGYKIIKITKDMSLEDFKCFVKRENTEEVLTRAGDQMLLQYLQLGLIDKDSYAVLVGRSSPDEIAMFMRKKAKDEREVARMTNIQNEEQMRNLEQKAAMEQQQQQQLINEQVAREDIKDLTDKKFKMKEIYAKELGSLAKTNPMAQRMIIDKNKQNLESTLV
jgi:hypothetical protein